MPYIKIIEFQDYESPYLEYLNAILEQKNNNIDGDIPTHSFDRVEEIRHGRFHSYQDDFEQYDMRRLLEYAMPCVKV